MRIIPPSDPTYGHFSNGERRRIAALIYRAGWLEKRIESAGNANLSYDRAELSALRWALSVIANREPAERNVDEREPGVAAG